MNLIELVVTLRKTPTYLVTLLNNTEDILLVYKENSKLQNEPDVSLTPQKVKNYANMDITGSPLKVCLDNTSLLNISNFECLSNFWTTEEENHLPISIQNANEFIMDFCNKNSKSSNLKSVWCICDSKDEKRTVLLSALQTPDCISRSLVTLEGFYPKSHTAIAFDTFCNKHLQYVAELTQDRQKIPLRQLQSNISCIYEIFGSKMHLKEYDNQIKGSVTLEVNWNVCCAKIPLDKSKSEMIVHTIVGQDISPVFPFWKELILLELYIKTLSEYNSETILNNSWLPSNINLTSEDNDIINIIIETINGGQRISRYDGRNDGVDLQKIIASVIERHTYDITDRLWTVLNQCSTYGALSDCLNIIFTEIAHTSVDIFVSDSNSTTMAQMIRGIVAGKIAVPRLTGTQPIEVLIDIGLEKLRKDFVHIFTTAKITNVQEMNKLFTDQHLESAVSLNEISKRQIRATLYYKMAVINFENIEKRMKILGQLHTVLEILHLVPLDWIQYAMKTVFDCYLGPASPIDTFATLAKNKSHEIRVDLPITDIFQHIEFIYPVIRRFSLTSVRKFCTVQSVFHLSQLPIFPPKIYKVDLPNETINETGEVYYHYTQLTQVTDFLKTSLR